MSEDLIAAVDHARQRPSGGPPNGPPQSELDAAIAGYQKASREHREAWERLDRARRDQMRAETDDAEARKKLVAARKRLDKALDADGVSEP